MASQSPFFGKRSSTDDNLSSRPAPLGGGATTGFGGAPAGHAAASPASSLTPGVPAGGAAAAAAAAKEGGSKLTVGPNIKLKGVEITDCDTLVVEGIVEATMDSRVIQIAEQGSFKGSVAIDIAEIRGQFDGDLTAREKLVIHATGKVTGKIRYGKIVIEEGGRLSGEVSVGTERIEPKAAASQPAEAKQASLAAA